MYNIEDLTFMVSLYCPGKCANCNIWEYDKKTITNNELDITTFQTLLKSDVLKQTSYFDLTAGESQLSEKYVDVVKAIGQSHYGAFIHTNISGWYPEKHYQITKGAIKYINPKKFRIDISLDGNEENYQKVRLVKNGFDKVIKTIHLLKELNIIIRIVMIVYKENYKDIPWFVNFAKENDIEYFIGYSRNAQLLNNKDNTINYTNKELDDIENNLNKVNWLTSRRKPNWLWAKSIYQNNIPLFDCYMGRKAIVIDPFGNVYPCNECLEFLKMGNLNDFNGNLDKLLYSKQALDVLNKVKTRQCQPCGMLCASKIVFPWGKQAGLQ